MIAGSIGGCSVITGSIGGCSVITGFIEGGGGLSQTGQSHGHRKTG